MRFLSLAAPQRRKSYILLGGTVVDTGVITQLTQLTHQMEAALKVRRIGNSLGVILPQTLLDTINVREGDELLAVPTDGGVTLTPYDPDFAAALEDAREFMRTHRNAFRELAQ